MLFRSIFSGGEKPVTYTIKLSRNAARWIQEEPWHADQKLEFESDGCCIMRVPAYHPMEIIPNVLKLGNEAQLLEPSEGRKEIKKIIQQLAKDYSEAKG